MTKAHSDVVSGSSWHKVVAALGVVFGDIGTSPLYAMRECFHNSHGVELSTANVMGVLSLIFWSLVIVVSVKYLMFVLRADNRGEGGILSLLALVEHEKATSPVYRVTPVIMLGLCGAALLYGDGIITPAITVLSAVEGLEVATPAFKPYVVNITVAILIAVFLVQKAGTARIGRFFGPVMLIWFLTLGVLGVIGIARDPAILWAINPYYAFEFIRVNQGTSFVVLGSVFLAVTGAEALYADMGHFGRSPIRRGWFFVVFPCLVLQYFGQGALLIHDSAAISNPFFLMAPSWGLYPLVGLATAAGVIASQALITGCFSLSSQATQLGFLPRIDIKQTSADEKGQIYVPFVNWVLLIGCVSLVFSFRTSTKLAAAYGIAVAGTMVITTLLLSVAAYRVWSWSPLRMALLLVAFIIPDLMFFSANVIKIPHGGSLPLVVAGILLFVMLTWKRGRSILAARMQERAPPLQQFLGDLPLTKLQRVPGAAIFMSATHNATPPALAQNVLHNKVLHERNYILTIRTRDIPHVPLTERARAELLTPEFTRLSVQFGFMDTPDVPSVLFGRPIPMERDPKHAELVLDVKDSAFFLGLDTLIATDRHGMALIRERLFAFMARNSVRASSYFNIPSSRVIQIGSVVDL